MTLTSFKSHFPIFQKTSEPLVYLDSAATSQKPHNVITAITKFYAEQNANIHRGVYPLAAQATIAYEKTRGKIARFLNAASNTEIIFTKSSTEAINLVATTYGLTKLQPHDEIILSVMEHHANIVPWQLIAERTGAIIRVIPLTPTGELDIPVFKQLLSQRTKIVALTHVSNVLGTINPIAEIIALAHEVGAITLIDGAQAFGHLPIDLQQLDCDFYCFSAHKSYGPLGVGILYGKKELLEQLPPYQTGGDMIEQVNFTKTTFAPVPQKFEAGTQNIAGIIALDAMIDFLQEISLTKIIQHEQQLLNAAATALNSVPGLKIIGNAPQKTGIISFTLDYAHPHDIATVFGDHGIAVRAGHHCAMPLMDFYKITGTTRISFALYNDQSDISQVLVALNHLHRLFT